MFASHRLSREILRQGPHHGATVLFYAAYGGLKYPEAALKYLKVMFWIKERDHPPISLGAPCSAARVNIITWNCQSAVNTVLFRQHAQTFRSTLTKCGTDGCLVDNVPCYSEPEVINYWTRLQIFIASITVVQCTTVSTTKQPLSQKKHDANGSNVIWMV